MLRSIFLASLLCLGSLAAAQTGPVGRDAEQPRTGKLVEVAGGDPEDLGFVQIGTPIERRVTLANASSGPVTLRVVGTSCPCTIAQLDRTTLESGQSATLKLMTRVSEVGERQFFTGTIEAVAFSPDGTASPSQQLTVGIAYTPDVELVLLPRILTFFVVARAESTFDAVARRLDHDRLAIRRVGTPEGWLAVKRVSSSDRAPGVAVITLEPATLRAGTYEGPLEVELDGQRGAATRSLACMRVESPMAADPGGVVFWETGEGWGKKEAIVTLRQRPEVPGQLGIATLGIEPPQSGIDAVLLPRSESGEESWRLTVRIDPEKLGDKREHGHCRVAVRDAAGELCSFPVVWLGKTAILSGPRPLSHE